MPRCDFNKVALQLYLLRTPLVAASESKQPNNTDNVFLVALLFIRNFDHTQRINLLCSLLTKDILFVYWQIRQSTKRSVKDLF